MNRDFETDKKNQCIENHIQNIKNWIATEYPDHTDIKIASLSTELPNLDRVISFYSENNSIQFGMECKTDYRSRTTGNIVIELISSMPPENYTLNTPILRVGQLEHKNFIKIVDNAIRGYIPARLGIGLSKYHQCTVLSYLSYPDDFMLMSTKRISKYVQEHFRDLDICITKSRTQNLEWVTAGCLVPVPIALDQKLTLKNKLK